MLLNLNKLFCLGNIFPRKSSVCNFTWAPQESSTRCSIYFGYHSKCKHPFVLINKILPNGFAIISLAIQLSWSGVSKLGSTCDKCFIEARAIVGGAIDVGAGEAKVSTICQQMVARSGDVAVENAEPPAYSFYYRAIYVSKGGGVGSYQAFERYQIARHWLGRWNSL